MSWRKRKKEAAYTSPSGTRAVFDYEVVAEEIDKNGTAYNFPDADGTYVQFMRRSGRRFPLRLIFWGKNYDLQIAAFNELLLEAGVGRLEHPIYGDFDVVPLGTIRRRDDLVNAANQGIIEVVFWETIGIVYPTTQRDAGASVLSAVEYYNAAAATELEEKTSLKTAVEKAGFKSAYQATLRAVEIGLKSIADFNAQVANQFKTINDSINLGIDTLVADPATLAFQTLLLIQSPARALTAIDARLDAYKNLISALISGDGAVVTPGYNSSNSNLFHNAELYVGGNITGLILSVLNTEFATKPAAIAAAETLLEQSAAVTAWADDNYVSLSEIDAGAAYQQLKSAVSLAAGFLVELSFDLKQEQSIVLTRNRTIVDLVAELYGEIDAKLDFFINSNNLSGSEIIEIEKGREIVYYV